MSRTRPLLNHKFFIKEISPCIAGRKTSGKLVYRVGKGGVPKGGKIKLRVPYYWDWGEVQIYDKRKENYLCFDVTNKEVEYIKRQEGHYIILEIVKGRLKEGNIINIFYGKLSPRREQGVYVTRWATITPYAGIWHRFELFVDATGKDNWLEANGSPIILNVVNNQATKFIANCQAMQQKGKNYELRVAAVDRYHNLVRDYRGIVKFSSTDKKAKLPNSYSFTKADGGAHTFKVSFYSKGVHTITVRAKENRVSGKTGPIIITTGKIDIGLFWGDIHGKSYLSDGVGSVDDYYRYARDVAGLDLIALTDHDGPQGRFLSHRCSFDKKIKESDLNISDKEWRYLKSKARQYNNPSRFVTLQAYEWTSNMCGHRNVYYLNDNVPLFSSYNTDSNTPQKLWKKLKGCKAITIPHHPSGIHHISHGGNTTMNWTIRNDFYQRIVEIFSIHGSSEKFGDPLNYTLTRHAGHFVQDALNMGHRLGIIASSDCHNGHPGLSGFYDKHGTSYRNSRHEKQRRGCLAAIYAPELTRKAIWNALWNRHCYGTTGKRIILKFTIDGHSMGEEYTTTKKEHQAEISVIGTARIKTIELLRNNHIIYTYRGKKSAIHFTYADKTNKLKESFYYVKVTQVDGEIAWSSPIWVCLK